jgi:hypothetical protein
MLNHKISETSEQSAALEKIADELKWLGGGDSVPINGQGIIEAGFMGVWDRLDRIACALERIADTQEDK